MFRSKVIAFFSVISVLGCTAQIVLPKPELNGLFVGDAANIEEAPFTVSIELFFFHICSGNIIGDDLILTAAQKIQNQNIVNLKVRVGTDTYGRGGQVFQIKEIIVHSEFDERSKDFDFALIRLQNKIVFDDKTSPIKISSEESAAGSLVTAFGWSTVGFRLNLQKVNANIIDGGECSNTYQQYGGITENMLCAKIDTSTNRFACGGDIGAALVVPQKSGIFNLVGTVSWGFGCYSQRYPIVYSKVSAVAGWIQSNSA